MEINAEKLFDCFQKNLQKFDVKTVRWEGEDPCSDPLQVPDLELDAMIIEVQKKLTEYDSGFYDSNSCRTKSLIPENLLTESDYKESELDLYFSDTSSTCSTEGFHLDFETEIDFLDIDCSFADINTDVAVCRFQLEFQQHQATKNRSTSEYHSHSCREGHPKVVFYDNVGFFLLLYELKCNRNYFT